MGSKKKSQVNSLGVRRGWACRKAPGADRLKSSPGEKTMRELQTAVSESKLR